MLSVEQDGEPYYDFAPLPSEVFSEASLQIQVNNSNLLNHETANITVFQVAHIYFKLCNNYFQSLIISIYMYNRLQRKYRRTILSNKNNWSDYQNTITNNQLLKQLYMNANCLLEPSYKVVGNWVTCCMAMTQRYMLQDLL